MVNRVISGTMGKRSKRLYVRFNECQYRGLQLLGVRSAQCPADVAYSLVMKELFRMSQVDVGFGKEWDRECSRIAKEEASK